jgi:hypothetical protein
MGVSASATKGRTLLWSVRDAQIVEPGRGDDVVRGRGDRVYATRIVCLALVVDRPERQPGDGSAERQVQT